MNYKALQDEVLAHGFAESYRTRVKTFLNTAQARIARHVQIRDLYTTATITTAAGTATYSLPSDFIRGYSLINVTDDMELEFVGDPNVLLLYNQGTANQSLPTLYSFNESGLLLSPVPNLVRNLTLSYYKRPTDMSADGDISILPADYHDVMISWALARCYRSEDDAQMAGFYMQEYNRDLALLATDRQYEEDGPRQVPGTWATDYVEYWD